MKYNLAWRPLTCQSSGFYMERVSLIGTAMLKSHDQPWHALVTSGGQSTQIKYLSKSTDTYNKILLQ